MTSEKYWRIPSVFYDVEYIVGLEMRDTDRVDVIVLDVQIIMERTSRLYVNAEYQAIAMGLEKELSMEYQDRFYFIEVGKDDEYWVQIFYPPTALRKVSHADS